MSPCCSARRPFSGSAATRSSIVEELRRLQVKDEWIHEIVRRKIVYEQDAFTQALPRRARAGEERADRPDQRRAGPGLRRRHAFHAALPAVAAAHRLRAGCGLLPQRQGRQGLRRHRRDRALRRERHPAEIGQDAAGRHRGHRDRLQSLCARRHRFRRRRQAARFRRHRHLSRHDVHGHSEHGLGVRLFPRQLDAAHRSGGGVRLPAA